MPKTILLAEDSVTMRQVVRMALSGQDCTIVDADSVDAALASARAAPPDLVLADLSMAGKNGYDLCAAVKQISVNTPVVLMHGSASGYDAARAAAVSADGEVSKPFDSQDLIDAVLNTVASVPPSGDLFSRAESLAPPIGSDISVDELPPPPGGFAPPPIPGLPVSGQPIPAASEPIRTPRPSAPLGQAQPGPPGGALPLATPVPTPQGPGRGRPRISASVQRVPSHIPVAAPVVAPPAAEPPSIDITIDAEPPPPTAAPVRSPSFEVPVQGAPAALSTPPASATGHQPVSPQPLPAPAAPPGPLQPNSGRTLFGLSAHDLPPPPPGMSLPPGMLRPQRPSGQAAKPIPKPVVDRRPSASGLAPIGQAAPAPEPSSPQVSVRAGAQAAPTAVVPQVQPPPAAARPTGAHAAATPVGEGELLQEVGRLRARIAELEGRLQSLAAALGDSDAVAAVSREVIERVAWDVVPDLVEAIIRERSGRELAQRGG